MKISKNILLPLIFSFSFFAMSSNSIKASGTLTSIEQQQIKHTLELLSEGIASANKYQVDSVIVPTNTELRTEFAENIIGIKTFSYDIDRALNNATRISDDKISLQSVYSVTGQIENWSWEMSGLSAFVILEKDFVSGNWYIYDSDLGKKIASDYSAVIIKSTLLISFSIFGVMILFLLFRKFV